MTEFSASVAGGRDMLLFCDKVVKDDIQVWIEHFYNPIFYLMMITSGLYDLI